MSREKVRVTLELPEEFLKLCAYDLVRPERVLSEFVADVCSVSRLASDDCATTFICNGAEDRDRAAAYYDQLHGWKGQWIRENLPHLANKE